jgi:hypothetical protein
MAVANQGRLGLRSVLITIAPQTTERVEPLPKNLP